MTSVLCAKEFERVDELARAMLAAALDVDETLHADELVMAAIEVAVRVIRERAKVSPRVALVRVKRIAASIAMLWPSLPSASKGRRFRHAPTRGLARDPPAARSQIPDGDPRQLSLFTD